MRAMLRRLFGRRQRPPSPEPPSCRAQPLAWLDPLWYLRPRLAAIVGADKVNDVLRLVYTRRARDELVAAFALTDGWWHEDEVSADDAWRVARDAVAKARGEEHG